ncbi:MAG TPA: phosphate ABC transporter substrate-binding protein PstS [Gammaproteobacteria bacterium]|nr:phosphate ABC transporter substrate-binding protein PstS [Gammaproteobacteria bacterium]
MRKALTVTLGAALIALGTAGNAAAANVDKITGAGSSFVYPILSKWATAYQKKTGVQLNYQSIGSGGGIKQIKAKTVDFGASDAPLTKKELEQSGLMQFPVIVGGVVPVVNVPGIKPGQLHLTNAELADIYLGKIDHWNDSRLKANNPNVDLPNLPIQVVHRSDGSGTTWIFTNYLSKVSSAWKSQVGNDKAVDWPVGIGGKGNEGVASYVNRVKGGIGYVEFAYALQNHMSYAKLRNRDGHYVDPKISTFQAAAAGADWKNAPGFYMVLTNQPGAQSWPITGGTFILMHTQQPNAGTPQAVLKFLDWGYRHGQKMAQDLDYVPLPDGVVKLIEQNWKQKLMAGGQPVWNGSMASE